MALQLIPQLRHLALAGNPCSLLPRYRQYVLQELPRLAYLDAVDDESRITKEERESVAAAGHFEPGDAVSVCVALDCVRGLLPPEHKTPADDTAIAPATEAAEMKHRYS